MADEYTLNDPTVTELLSASTISGMSTDELADAYVNAALQFVYQAFQPAVCDEAGSDPDGTGGFTHMTDNELQEIEDRLAGTSKGEWRACGDGKCRCMTVGVADHPVAEFTTGEWGDEYADLRLTGSSLDKKVEPFMNLIPYGEVDPSEAAANAVFAAHAHQDIPRLLAEIRELRSIAGFTER